MLYAKAIYDLGSTPMITWEPWLNDFNREDDGLPEVTDPNKHGLADIANGKYDFYIKKWALQAKAFGHNILIRYGHEMNDPYRYPWGPQNNKPEEYIAAWRHVVNVFRNVGANNVIWVWSPQPAYLQYQEYYPGSDYVDWVGVGALNYGTVAPWSKWWSFKEIFGDYYTKLDVFKKPLMITEMGSLDVGGNKTEWFRKAFTDLSGKYPDLKAILFFNDNNDNTTLNKSLNWSITNDTLTCRAIQQAIEAKW
jgi:beta-mannanase